MSILKFKEVSLSGTHLLAYLHTEFPFEETVARLYNLSDQDIFAYQEEKCIFELMGKYDGEPFSLYDYKGDQRIHIGGRDTLDVTELSKHLVKLVNKTKPKFFTARSVYLGENFSYPPPLTSYVMMKINFNMGSDILGTYFIQYNNNKKNLKKFLLINSSNSIKYYPDKKYTHNQVMQLKNFDNLFCSNWANNVEVLMLSGKLNVPGENIKLDRDELEKWWIQYLGSTAYPSWSNIVDNVVDLAYCSTPYQLNSHIESNIADLSH